MAGNQDPIKESSGVIYNEAGREPLRWHIVDGARTTYVSIGQLELATNVLATYGTAFQNLLKRAKRSGQPLIVTLAYAE
jgi:hypothetical protein